MSKSDLTHIDGEGRARMVDVEDKPESKRFAKAKGEVRMQAETLNLIREGAIGKGDVITVAEIAGTMAAKKTSELIPLCHPVPLNHVEVKIELLDELPGIEISATAKSTSKTGVEMEALTAVCISALTIYDMLKSAEKAMRIENIRLVEKFGGLSGDVQNE